MPEKSSSREAEDISATSAYGETERELLIVERHDFHIADRNSDKERKVMLDVHTTRQIVEGRE